MAEAGAAGRSPRCRQGVQARLRARGGTSSFTLVLRRLEVCWLVAGQRRAAFPPPPQDIPAGWGWLPGGGVGGQAAWVLQEAGTGWRSPRVSGTPVLAPSWAGCNGSTDSGGAGSFARVLQGRCGQSCWSPPAAEGIRVGQSICHGVPRPARHGARSEAGAREPVNTAQKFSFKVWNDLWIITDCDRVGRQAWVTWGWGAQEDNGDKSGPKGMCTLRSRGRRGQRKCRLLLCSQTQPALIILSHHRR